MRIGKNSFKGGANVPHYKNTLECKTEAMGIPDKVVIPMLQHIGAPCNPVVSKGDTVKLGQLIGSSESYVSAPIHASVSGKVTDISTILTSVGTFVPAVVIEPDKKQEIHEDVKPPRVTNREEFLEAVKQSGLVGLGGAGFPTHVKLSVQPGRKIDYLLINGAECEPFITSDYREMVENGEGIIEGAKIIMKFLGIPKTIIGVEDNKPEAISKLTALTRNEKDIDVVRLKSRYPQGGEKVLIYALTGRKVPSGKLPLDIGVIVINVNSASFINEYIKTGMPLVKKRVTIDGPAVARAANVEVPIGTQIKDVFDYCGGFKNPPAKIIMGGPMMGVTQYSLELPVMKQTNAVLAFDENMAKVMEENPCIRCGRCVNACPMNLLPLTMNALVRNNKIEELGKYHIMDCMECGSCSFVCPSKRHLVQSFKLGKARLRAAAAQKKG